MRMPILLLLTLFTVLAPTAHAERPPLAVSIHPLAFLLTELVEDDVEISVVLAPEISAHDFSLRPSQLRALRAANQVFWMGPRLEHPLEPVFNAYPDIVNTALLSEDEKVDAHAWLDPEHARRLVRQMYQRLSEMDYNGRVSEPVYTAVLQQLMETDRAVASRLAPVLNLPFVVLHDAWSALVSRYGLNQVGALTRDAEHGASLRDLSNLQQRAAGSGAGCLVVEPLGEGRLPDSIVRDTGLSAIVIDPMGAQIPIRRGAYHAFMMHIADTLAGCLEASEEKRNSQ